MIILKTVLENLVEEKLEIVRMMDRHDRRVEHADHRQNLYCMLQNQSLVMFKTQDISVVL